MAKVVRRVTNCSMNNFDSHLSFFIIMATMCYTPGPGILLIVNKCLNHGFRSAFQFAIGITIGHTIISIVFSLSIDWALHILPNLLIYIKYLGVGFLLYLAVNSLIPKKNKASQNDSLKAAPGISSIEGLLFTFVNPKALVLYMAVIPVNLGQKIYYTPQFVLMNSLIVLLVVGSSTMGYAYLAKYLIKILHTKSRQYALNVISATVIIVIAFLMLKY